MAESINIQGTYYPGLPDRVEVESIKERRSITQMAVILIEEALDSRRLKEKDSLPDVFPAPCVVNHSKSAAEKQG